MKYQWQFDGVNTVGATNATLSLNNVQASHEGSYQVVISTGAGSFTSAEAAFTLITPPELLEQTEPERQWAGLAGQTLEVGVSGHFLSYQWKLNGTNIQYATAEYYVVPFFHSSEERHYSVAITNAAGVTNSRTWKVKALPPGGIAAWGRNNDNQLAWPVTATNVIAVAAGLAHSLVAREDGSVVAWGLNDAGQTNAPTLTNAIAVAAGNKHNLALRDNGTVAAWGRNAEGQSTVPAGLTNVIAIGAGGNQSIALRKNGTVTNWGNTNGTIPGNLTNAIAIAAGTNFCVALRSNGTVTAWGNNDQGQTSVPGNATNVVAVAAGAFHTLALRENGTVVAWGLNTSSQCVVPGGLSNVLAVAAGRAHSAALKNDGTVVAWGDNTYEQTDVGGGLKGIKLLAAGGDHTLASAFSRDVQYQVEVSKDLLLVYNSSSTDSIWVKDYYLAHRPMVSGANVLGINCPTNEIITPGTFTNDVLEPYLAWLEQNPTKRPQYVIAFLDIPSRVHESTNRYDSVFYQLHTKTPSHRPFVTTINMGGTNDCRAYIDKLAAFGTNGQVLISASAGGYGNTNYVVDNVHHDSYGGETLHAATNGLLSVGVPFSSITYLEDEEPCTQQVTNIVNGIPLVSCVAWEPRPHITNAVDVAGYISWGSHSELRSFYALPNGAVKWSTNSAWYIVQTIESNNGMRLSDQGNFIHWFSASAFGGTNHSNTPVGAVTHVDEPHLHGVNDSGLYFGLWAKGKSFGIAAWNSRRTERFQAVGDPFVVK